MLMNSNSTDEGLIISGTTAFDDAKTGVATVKLVRAANDDRLYTNSIYRRSDYLPGEIDLIIQRDLSIDGRIATWNDCGPFHAEFVMTPDSVSLWGAAFNNLPGAAQVIANAAADAEDRPQAPVVASAPPPQLSQPAPSESSSAPTVAEQEAPYNGITIDQVVKGTEALKNVVEAWRTFWGPPS